MAPKGLKRALEPCAADPAGDQPKKAKLTPEEKAQQLIQRANAATEKANKAFVNDTMNEHPVVVTSLVNHLKQLGYRKPDAQSQAVSPPKGTLAEQQELRDDIPGCYRRLDAVPPSYLNRLCTNLEPVAFSPQQCKLLSTTGRKCQQKEPFLQLLEAVCEIDREMPLVQPDGRDFHDINLFTEYLTMLSKALGRRGRDMTLPPKWQDKGLFFKMVEGDSLTIFERYGVDGFPTRSGVINWKTEGIKDPTKVYFSENWSMSRARLREEDAHYAKSVEALLPPRPPNQMQLMITDGAGGNGVGTGRVASQVDAQPAVGNARPPPQASAATAAAPVLAPTLALPAAAAPEAAVVPGQGSADAPAEPAAASRPDEATVVPPAPPQLAEQADAEAEQAAGAGQGKDTEDADEDEAGLFNA